MTTVTSSLLLSPLTSFPNFLLFNHFSVSFLSLSFHFFSYLTLSLSLTFLFSLPHPLPLSYLPSLQPRAASGVPWVWSNVQEQQGPQWPHEITRRFRLDQKSMTSPSFLICYWACSDLDLDSGFAVWLTVLIFEISTFWMHKCVNSVVIQLQIICSEYVP